VNNPYSGIVEKIKSAVHIASATPNNPEAKLRELVAPLWDDYIRSKRINLHFYPRDERQLANGRADTVFNRLILEYKKPGVIHSNNEKNRKLTSQVKGYIEDLAKEERWKEKRLLGVAFDGHYFLFIRKVGRWIEENPIAVSDESVERFLLILEKLTTKAALVPDNLIRDFAVGAGSLNYIASNTIKAFYFALTKNVNERVKVFFEQWALQFAEVHGAIENKKFDAETLFKSYGFKKEEQRDFDFLAFFFALDTYYGLLMKLLAYQVVVFYTLKDFAGLPLTEWEKFDSHTFKDKLASLEEGGVFRADPLNIRNFLEGDLLSWYLNDWNDEIEEAIRVIIERLNQYDPETMELIPDETRDILKKLYQYLVPKQIRHDLGEYYTPDWLAERCLNQVGYGVKERDLLQKRVLDPGCGSGTFLILAIKRAKEHARIKGIDPAETLTLITKNIVGFDLNPLAVISARTNYLLAVADLLKYKKGEITIPIYLCDSINPPSAKQQDDLFDDKAGHYQISTSVGLFHFPEALVQKAAVQRVTTLLEDGVKKKQSTKLFLERVHSEMKTEDEDRNKIDLSLGETYDKLIELEQKGINGIWARIIKNAFAPSFVGQFDLIVGNPPWVNWESLPEEYRDKTSNIWQHYNLFEHTGLRARLGSAKDDISVLMTYVSIDKYLKDNGKLCFVITQTLFKTVGGGDGFRRFRLGKEGTPFKVMQVDDMVELQPFDSTTNKTSVFICKKGQETTYPVEYHLWKKNGTGSIDIDMTWEEIVERTEVKYLKAESVDDSEQSPWITGIPKAIKAIKKVMTVSPYRAREGSSGGLNSVYLIKVLGKNGGLLRVVNFTENAKKKVQQLEANIEPDLIFPTLRGREIIRWQAKPEIAILLPQDLEKPSNGMSTQILKRRFPKTSEYLEFFRTELENRSILKHFLKNQPFYALYNTGPYSFASFKVVWTRVGNDIKCAVVGDEQQQYLKNCVVTPIETVVFVPFEDLNESHFFCALLNSTISRFAIFSYSNKGTGSFGSPHILDHIAIPKYDELIGIHKELSKISMQCHEKVSAGISVSDLEDQNDQFAAELWGLTKEELKDIKDSLEEMR